MEKKKLTYKEAVKEVEGLLEQLENEELDVDELSEKVKRVSVLLKFCKDKLAGTEKEVRSIIEDMNNDEQ